MVIKRLAGMRIRMKIVQINTVCGKGSVGRITVDLYHVLENAKEEPLIAYGRDKAPEGMNTYKIGTKFDFYIHVLGNFFTGKNGFFSKKQTLKLIQWLEKEKPDVIHLHNIHGFYLQVELLFSYLKEHNIPVVWTFHDCYPFTGHCAYFDYAGCDKWKTECDVCKYHAEVYPYALFKDNAKWSYYVKKAAFTGHENLTIVTPSTWLSELVKQSFLKEYPVRIIPNGIDLSVFKDKENEEKRKEQEKKIVLGVANVWEERKGLKFFEQLPSLLGDDYRIVLVGVDKKTKKRLEKVYSKSQLELITRTENTKALAVLYAKATVFVNPTLEDNFPTTNIEALACGTPVVTFETGGSGESVTRECGRVVPKGNIMLLAEAIREMAELDPTRTAKLCRAQAQNYEKNERYLEYRTLYHEIVKKESRR